jgi:hypothetical protein
MCKFVLKGVCVLISLWLALAIVALSVPGNPPHGALVSWVYMGIFVIVGTLVLIVGLRWMLRQ